MGRHVFTVVRDDLDQAENYGKPTTILRLVQTAGQELTTRIEADEEIEDPRTDQFILVFGRLASGHYVCSVRDRFMVMSWLRPDASSFSRFSLPLVKKRHPTLLASKLFSVQPMT